MKHAVITGASSGIGKSLAHVFAQKGYALTLVARRLDLLESLKQELSTPIECIQADLSDLSSGLKWMDQLQSLDVFINNAGMQYVEPLENIEPERIEKLITLNLTMPLALMHKALKIMLPRNSGSIVNVASVAGLTGAKGMCHYNATKAGLASASESARVELKKKGVHVLTVYPGPVSTPMEQASRQQLKDTLALRSAPTGTPDKLAQLIFDGVQKKKVRIIYPATYKTSYYFRNFSQWVSDRISPEAKE